MPIPIRRTLLTLSPQLQPHPYVHMHMHWCMAICTWTSKGTDKDTMRTLPNLQMSSPVFIGAVAYKPRPKTGSVRISYGTGIEAPVTSGLCLTSAWGGSRTWITYQNVTKSHSKKAKRKSWHAKSKALHETLKLAMWRRSNGRASTTENNSVRTSANSSGFGSQCKISTIVLCMVCMYVWFVISVFFS